MRPVAVTVIGILGIIWGILGICCSASALGLVGFLPQMAEITQQQGQSSQEVQTFLQNQAAYRLALVGGVIGILLSLWLLIASILLMRMSPTGYTLMMVNAGITIVWSLVEMALSFVVLQGDPATMISAPLALIMRLALPVAILIVLTRPNIKEAFQRSF